MMIHRDLDGDMVNRIISHPEVRPWVLREDQDMDFRAIARDPRIYLLVGEPPVGSIIFAQVTMGVYEAHAAVLPQGRGNWTTDLAQSSIYYMFTATDCIEILTRVLEGHVGAAVLARQLGFRERWRCPAFQFRGKMVPYSVWGTTMMDWWPSNDPDRVRVYNAMYHAGQPEKAKAWHTRWAALSQKVETA